MFWRCHRHQCKRRRELKRATCLQYIHRENEWTNGVWNWGSVHHREGRCQNLTGHHVEWGKRGTESYGYFFMTLFLLLTFGLYLFCFEFTNIETNSKPCKANQYRCRIFQKYRVKGEARSRVNSHKCFLAERWGGTPTPPFLCKDVNFLNCLKTVLLSH